MNPPAFLLALAPAATAVAKHTVAAAKDTGASFASMLGNMTNATAAPLVAEPDLKPTLAETLQSLADKLRNWLSENGVDGEFAIDYHVAADGDSQFNVTGSSADSVKQLLATDSSWLDKLRQLASTMQAKSAQLSRDYASSSVTIEIDPQQANAF